MDDLGDAAVLRLRAESVSWRIVDDEIVALDIDAGLYFGGNQAATLLWQALADGATRAALIAGLASAYDLDSTVAAGDVDAFLDRMRDHGLLD